MKLSIRTQTVDGPEIDGAEIYGAISSASHEAGNSLGGRVMLRLGDKYEAEFAVEDMDPTDAALLYRAFEFDIGKGQFWRLALERIGS